MRRLAVLAALVSALLPATSLVTARAVVAAPDGVIRVGSKSFTESYLLAEMVAQVVEQVGEARAERRVGLGGTGLTPRALESGALDVYPAYTGTSTRVTGSDLVDRNSKSPMSSSLGTDPAKKTCDGRR